ncbi:MAG: pilus assembly protein TadG-related protein [Paracoccaceae bacterium]
MKRFRDDEGGSMAFFMLLMFVLMIIFGGIAVDVMRFETRRVAMQQTMDRAALAAASLTQTRTPEEIAEEWFEKSGLGEDLVMVEFSDPTVSAVSDAGLRRVTMSARVRSYNFFMSIFSNNDYLEGPTTTEAAQGVSQIEVMLVLDITGSMNNSAGNGKTKIQALRDAAIDFVTIVKGNDTRDGVSIGMVPYAAQVNIPVNLRNQFNAIDISSWNGIANAGVPNIDCMEIPTSTYTSTGLSLTDPIRMAAVADANNDVTVTTDYVAPVAPNPTSRACTTVADNAGTPHNEATANQVFLPTKNGDEVIERVSRLVAAGNTYIAVGMRWGTALIDEAARPIYTSIGDATVQGRPADNDSLETRKIIILMTDGSHVTNNYIKDGYKSGLSPIWRGDDGRFAIQYTAGGPARTDGTRPACAGTNTYFVPHLKPNSDTTCNTAASAGRVAWLATPAWSGSGTVRQLDWSEVWRYVRVRWVARQLYMRSNVTGTGNFNTIRDMFLGTYLSSVNNMNSLLQTNCAAARDAGIEIYGIAFAAPAAGQTQINGCSSSPKENYYYNATDGDKLLAAFRAIATDISELRLTQ